MTRPQFMNLPEVDPADLIPVRVRVRQLDYITREKNVLGDEVDVLRPAYGPGDPRLMPTDDLETDSQEYLDRMSDYAKGQLILVRPHQYVGLQKSGAVVSVQYDPDTDEEVDDEEQLLNVATASVDDLVLWIQQERPTVNDVVQASGGDKSVATRLLEAESKAQDGEPRKGVLEGLTTVISRG